MGDRGARAGTFALHTKKGGSGRVFAFPFIFFFNGWSVAKCFLWLSGKLPAHVRGKGENRAGVMPRRAQRRFTQKPAAGSSAAPPRQACPAPAAAPRSFWAARARKPPPRVRSPASAAASRSSPARLCRAVSVCGRAQPSAPHARETFSSRRSGPTPSSPPRLCSSAAGLAMVANVSGCASPSAPNRFSSERRAEQRLRLVQLSPVVTAPPLALKRLAVQYLCAAQLALRFVLHTNVCGSKAFAGGGPAVGGSRAVPRGTAPPPP